MTELHFADAEALADLGTLVSRAKAVEPEGAIRLQAHGRTLAAYVGVLAGTGLMAEGAVIGLRTMPLAEESEVDVTVPLSAVSDRLARRDPTPTLSIPPVTVSAAWAAVAPPRSGWERVGVLTADVVNAAAREGIQAIAEGSPQSAGGHAVTALRQQVWRRSTTTTPPIPAGGAFAAYVLGFTPPGSEVTVLAQGRWTRLTTAAGHVLVR